jgi:hypothetical protein
VIFALVRLPCRKISLVTTGKHMTLIRFRYLQEQGIFNDRMALARAIDHYGFPKPIALGDNTLAWDLEKEVEPWLKSRPRRTPKCAAASKRPSAVVGDA